MKKLLALLLALMMVLSLAACGGSGSEEPAADEDAGQTMEMPTPPEPRDLEPIDPAQLKIGMVCIGDDNSGYDVAHLTGLRAACEALGVPAENIIYKYNTPETEMAYDACVDCAEQGCQVIFTDSYGHQEHTLRAAQEYPDVTFFAMTGDQGLMVGLPNLKNAFNHTFESRYVSGVVAGMKLAEMIANGELTDANYDENGNAKIGYVGAYPYAEVVSGYTAFYLGVRSIVENVVMDVQYTNSWFDQTGEGAAAEALMSNGCCIISQHADSTGAPSAVQAAHEAGSNVYCVGYNIDMRSVAPDTALTSAANDWSVYYTFALQSLINGEDVNVDWSAGYAEGANKIFPLNESIVAEGTAEKVAEVEAAIADGSLQVFDCSTFTVGGEHPTSFLAIDLDGDFNGDVGEAIVDGVFQESTLRSAPYFSLRIDGITELNAG